MSILKIVAVALIATIPNIECSVLAPAVAPVPALPAFRYTQVAPPSVLPFSAQVSTFTRNLHVFDAPYAAGVIPGPPPIVQRALLPAPVAPIHPAPYIPAPAPYLPAPAPYLPAPVPYLPAPAPYFPAPVAPVAPVAPIAPVAPVAPIAPAPFLPAPAIAKVAPGWPPVAPVLPFADGWIGPVARSVHAVAPAIAPAPLLG